MTWKEKHDNDVSKLRKENPDLDIVEVSYDSDGELCAMATREIPESLKVFVTS